MQIDESLPKAFPSDTSFTLRNATREAVAASLLVDEAGTFDVITHISVGIFAPVPPGGEYPRNPYDGLEGVHHIPPLHGANGEVVGYDLAAWCQRLDLTAERSDPIVTGDHVVAYGKSEEDAARMWVERARASNLRPILATVGDDYHRYLKVDRVSGVSLRSPRKICRAWAPVVAR